MSDEDQKRVFTRNLHRLIDESGKTQKEIADAIGVTPQRFNTWYQGISIPRIGVVQALADYFGVPKSALIDEDMPYNPRHYINDDTLALAQQLHDDKDLRMMFDTVKDLPPDAMQYVKDTLLYLEKIQKRQ